MTTVTDALLTTEELLALPDDGMDRELIEGRLREKPMTRRNRRHGRTESNIAGVLRTWLLTRPAPRGEILSGEAGFRIRRDPDTTVGIDVAYISAHTASANADDVSLIDGVPVLAVEILSPSDTHEDVADKVRSYLDAAVPVVWVVDPVFRTVTVYTAGAQPVLFNTTQRLEGGQQLPGFAAAVADFFEI